MSTKQTIKELYHSGGIVTQIIGVNIAVFLAIRIVGVFLKLSNFNELSWYALVQGWLGAKTSLLSLLLKPWTFFTYAFVHFDLFHLLWNMLFLYFAGQMFLQLFSRKQFIYTYLLAAVFGLLVETLSRIIFPGLSYSVTLVGASASVMGIFMAIAFYRPKMTVLLFGMFPVKIIVLAMVFLVLDVLSLSSSGNVAHFAHIGGALFGYLSIKYPKILYQFDTVIEQVKKIFKRKPKMKVVHRQYKTDEEYNLDKKRRQEEIDRILEKISKSGYESLTKREKDFLFRHSQR